MNWPLSSNTVNKYVELGYFIFQDNIDITFVTADRSCTQAMSDCLKHSTSRFTDQFDHFGSN